MPPNHEINNYLAESPPRATSHMLKLIANSYHALWLSGPNQNYPSDVQSIQPSNMDLLFLIIFPFFISGTHYPLSPFA